MPVRLTKYGSIGKVTYYGNTVNDNKKDLGKSAFEEAFEKAGVSVSGNRDKKYSFGGIEALTADKEARKKAVIMEREGKGADEIRKESRDGRKILYDINNIKEIDSGVVASKGTQHNNQSLNKRIPQNNKKSTRETKYSMEVEDNLLGDRLDITEWNQFLKLIGDYQRGDRFQISQEGDIIIPINNKLVYTDGDYENPGIRIIIEFNSDYEDEIDEARRQIYDFEKTKSSIKNAHNAIESYFGQGFISEYAYDSGRNAKGFDRPTERRKSISDTYHIKREQNRKRVYIQNGKLVEYLKLSMDVDLEAVLEDEYSKEELERASLIQEGFESLKNVNVNENLVRKVAYHLKKDYKSSYDLELNDTPFWEGRSTKGNKKATKNGCEFK